MPIDNPYYIKENLVKTEQVIYLDQNYQPQSFEEFMKTYEPDEKVEFITEAEYQDRVLRGSQYGPGNSQSNYRGPPRNRTELRNWDRSGGRSVSSPRPIQSASESTGFIIETYLKASAAVAITTATGGLAPVVGGAMWIGGELLQSTNEDFLKFAGSKVKNIGSGTFFAGLFSNLTIGEVAKNSGVSLKDLEWFYEAKGNTETIYAVGKHGEHRSRGVSYDSDCEVCNRNS